MNLKQVAGEKAAHYVESGMIVGLGTGSTAYFAIRKLGDRIREEGLDIKGIPTSISSEKLALEFGVPLVTLKDIDHVDITIDGADEIDKEFHMIKGGGGALLREKMVASITGKEIIVVDPDKVVEVLGKEFPLPVEVTRFGWELVQRRICNLGCTPVLRVVDGENYLTDNCNYILDCKFQGISDPEKLENELNRIPGVVENGLFNGLVHMLIIGRDTGAEIRD